MFKFKKEIFKFTGKSHSFKGILSVILGGISLAAFILLAVISCLSHGNGGILLGIFGILLFILSLTGMILGIKGCKEKEIYYTAPIAGMVLNGLLSVFLFALYMIGIVL